MKTDDKGQKLHPQEIVLVTDFGQEPTQEWLDLMPLILNGKLPAETRARHEAVAVQYKRQLLVLFGIETKDPWPKRSH